MPSVFTCNPRCRGRGKRRAHDAYCLVGRWEAAQRALSHQPATVKDPVLLLVGMLFGLIVSLEEPTKAPPGGDGAPVT